MSATVNAFQYEEPGKATSLALAIFVHLLLAAFLIFSVHWRSHEPEAVTAELWSSLPAPQQALPKPQKVEPAPPPKPVPKIEPKPEPKPVEKAIEPRKPDIALEKKKEIKKPVPKEEIKKDIPKKLEPKKAEPKLNLDFSKNIREQLERETAAMNQQLDKDRILAQMRSEAASAAASADAAYIGKLKGKIRSNIVLPPDIVGNPEAIFDVVQLPTGEVISVTLRKSSGYKPYDAAVERAILKSSPLPRPDRPEQFRRNLEIKFRPQD